MSWDAVVTGAAPPPTEPTGAYRAVRRVTPPASPLEGIIASQGDDSVVLVPVEQLDGWEGWRSAGSQHVLAPLDIVRLADGHAVVLPRCDDTVEARLAHRAARGPVLRGGEAVTLAVSLLRGVQEAWAQRPPGADAPRGRWWLSADARPLFAFGDGDPVEESAASLLAAAGECCPDKVVRRVLDDVRVAFERPRALRRTGPDLETRLFEACAPQPLAEDGPSDVRPDHADLREDARPAAPSEGWLVHRVDVGLGELVADAFAEVGRRMRARGTARRVRPTRAATGSASPAGGPLRRRAPIIVGAICGGAVLAVGLAWPSATDDASPGPGRTGAADDGDASSTVVHATSAPPAPAAEATPPTEHVPTADATATGVPTPSAEEETPEQATARLVEGAADAALVDDFGDVAVTRVEGDGIVRHVVLERVDGVWQLRQTYETAEGAG
ncbi:hypothetical protein [Microbacterium gilvum]|uniref:Uncharacterized protein n=1 Tax=Microbacterium gilvum TaxID=1336204 RepID=A0ABP8ZUD9_9MICO